MIGASVDNRLLRWWGQPRGDGVEPSADPRRVINGTIDLNRPAAISPAPPSETSTAARMTHM
jgi:hypothetical protein